MAEKTHTLTFKRLIEAPPAEVYRAFTHATLLRDWLCHAAQADPRPGGRLYLWWHTGYYSSGEYSVLEPGRKIAFSWHGRGEPNFTRVMVTLRPERGGRTRLSLAHKDIGHGRKWSAAVEAFAEGWSGALENLQSVLETGLDLRLMRRPLMGLFIGEFSPEAAARLGVPVRAGIRLAGTMPGSGAEAAGLQTDDVLVSLGGRRTGDLEGLAHALEGRQAGNELKAVYYRGPEKRGGMLKLGSRPVPDYPAAPAELAAAVRKLYRQRDREIARLLKGVTEAQADSRPAPGEWNAKELICHFIACERDLQAWIAAMLNDNIVPDSLEYQPNVTPRLQAMAARFRTVPKLMRELKLASEETAALLEALPPEFVRRRHLYQRVAGWTMEGTLGHLIGDHDAQLKAILEAARK